MGRAALRFALSLGALSLLCACVTVPEFQSLRRDVEKLKRSGGSAPARADSWADKPAPAGDRLAEQGAEIDELQAEVARLRGEIETLLGELERSPDPSLVRGAIAARRQLDAPNA